MTRTAIRLFAAVAVLAVATACSAAPTSPEPGPTRAPALSAPALNGSPTDTTTTQSGGYNNPNV